MRRIKKAKIKFVSLVPKGANRFPVLYKSDGMVEFRSLSKMEENGELLSVVYAPNIVDSDGDFAEAEVIKEMAHEFLKDGGSIDLQHDGQPLPKEKAYVAESFIVAKGDERFKDFRDYDGNKVDVTGGWALLIKIEDPELRKLYREGRWNGVSMAGPAQVEEVKAAKSDNPLFAAVRKVLGIETEDEVDELKELLKQMNARLEALEADKKAALEKAQKEAEEAKRTELEELKRQVEELKKANKVEKEDKEKSEEKPEDKLARLQKEKEKLEKKSEELKKELEELQKASNQPLEKEEKNEEIADLAKEDLKLIELGRKMAKFVNEQKK